MRLLFIINTPGQAHTWKHVITQLMSLGHVVKIIARDYDFTPAILSACGFQFETFETVGSRYTRLFGALKHFKECINLSRDFAPSAVIGFGIDAAVTAVRLQVPSIVFVDDDQTAFQNRLTSLLGSTIITPFCFRGKLGKKHILIRGYKELAYLHPNYFTPDITIFDELNLSRGDKYIILRFGSMDAVHDILWQGLPPSDKHKLVQKLSEHARVFISPEGQLPAELRKFQLPIAHHRFHHVLYYARMFVCDTGTAASEAAILGTPAVLYGSDALRMGNFRSLGDFGLLYSYNDPQKALNKAFDLVRQPRLKEDWAAKSKKMLSEMIDVSRFLTDFIHDFADGIDKAGDPKTEV